ncbi:hypothetical protein IC620_09490 [Hazenella sp. IB182357]|uniref:Uncharacterized protein n=1 Tax=Polycladospora coralii TaxID=2771432 RepID=A0A926RXJ8_9BACL|nr:hypothetical protein [Polycladospora coralii]MBD1372586.1 hypothetical protein [Polycladospora coralii]
MPQLDGKNRLKRMEFVYQGRSYPFFVNPEEYTQDEPSRSTVMQTKGGAWVDDFGAGLPLISIRGNTGFQKGEGEKRFKALRQMIRDYYAKGGELTFHNWTDDESWVVHTEPQGFRLLRNKANPLLFVYDIRLICLRKATHPQAVASTGGSSALPQVPRAIRALQPFLQKQLHLEETKLPPLPLVNQIRKLVTVTGGKMHHTPTAEAVGVVGLAYRPQLSQVAQRKLTQLQAKPDVAYTSLQAGTLPAQLLELERRKVRPQLVNGVRMVLLEALALWQSSSAGEKITASELEVLIENTHWLAEEVKAIDFVMTANLRRLGRLFQSYASVLRQGVNT